MTSSKYTSFMERAGITDAFSHNRRIGAALVANDKTADKWTAQAGIFSEEMNANDFNRTGWVFAARGVFSPTIGTTRLHLGANFEHRDNRREAQSRNYQLRPMTQLTDQRFMSTGALSAGGDNIVGVEAAAIFKQFYDDWSADKIWVHGTYTPRRAGRQAAGPRIEHNSQRHGSSIATLVSGAVILRLAST